MLKCYVIFILLLLGVMAWTLKEADMKKAESFEMWCHKRILSVPKIFSHKFGSAEEKQER